MTFDEEVCQIIKDAASLIEDKGWVKGMFFNPDNNSFCMIGALNQASGYIDYLAGSRNDDRVKFIIAAQDKVSQELQELGYGLGLANFNDEHSKNEVLEVPY